MQTNINIRSKNITKLALFILILCTTAIGPQEPEDDGDEDDSEPTVYYFLVYTIPKASDSENVSSLRSSSCCKPIAQSDPVKRCVEPTMEWENAQFKRDSHKIHVMPTNFMQRRYGRLHKNRVLLRIYAD